MNIHEVKKGIASYRSHHHPRKEAYEFNIKVGRIHIPEEVRQRVEEEQLENIVQNEMNDALTGFMDWLEGDFAWIGEWGQEGRSGGWLVLEPKDPVLTEYGEIEDIKEAHQRLKDLNEIDDRVRKGVRELETNLSSRKHWFQLVPLSRKHWDPREK